MFDIAYGHYAGSGSDVSDGVNASKFATKAVYNQFANVVLDDPNQKFAFSDLSTGHGAPESGATEDDVYIFSAKSAKMKDRVATKWTITLSGSAFANAGQNYGSSSLVMTTYTASKFSSLSCCVSPYLFFEKQYPVSPKAIPEVALLLSKLIYIKSVETN